MEPDSYCGDHVLTILLVAYQCRKRRDKRYETAQEIGQGALEYATARVRIGEVVEGLRLLADVFEASLGTGRAIVA